MVKSVKRKQILWIVDGFGGTSDVMHGYAEKSKKKLRRKDHIYVLTGTSTNPSDEGYSTMSGFAKNFYYTRREAINVAIHDTKKKIKKIKKVLKTLYSERDEPSMQDVINPNKYDW